MASEAREERRWTPLRAADYAVLISVFLWQLFALMVCIHLFLNRRWPPYVTKNVTLVIVTGLSGVLWSWSMTLSWGFWNRQPGDFLAQCDMEVFLTWSSVSLHAATFMVRPYRVWKLLVKHDGNMWPTLYQTLLLTSVCLVPIVAAWVDSSGAYDYNTNFCGIDELSQLMGAFMNMVGLSTCLFLWCVCVRQLRWVRKQYNEYESLTWTLLAASLMLVTYPLIINFVLSGDALFQRRLSIMYPVLTSYVMFWGPIREPFSKKLMGDEGYLLTFTQGFSSLPTPAQLKASLAEQLSVDELRAEFRKYIKTKIAQELIDFYQDSLDREEVTDFFERQAMTMRIIDQFIRVGSKDQVNISEGCRERVLETDVTAHTIFDEARNEVLRIMETNFQHEFAASVGFRKMVDAAEREERELSLLRAEGMVPSLELQLHSATSGCKSARNSSSRNSFRERHDHGHHPPTRELPSSAHARTDSLGQSVFFGTRISRSWKNRLPFHRSSASIGDDDVEVPSLAGTSAISVSVHSDASSELTGVGETAAGGWRHPRVGAEVSSLGVPGDRERNTRYGFDTSMREVLTPFDGEAQQRVGLVLPADVGHANSASKRPLADSSHTSPV